MLRIAYCIGDYPEEEFKRREQAAMAYASDEIHIGIIRVAASPYQGLDPASIQAVASLFHEAYMTAEREGFDAVVPLGMLDLGVDGGRSLVDIPVIGPSLATLHVAAMVGERFGVICYQAHNIPRHRAQARAYGMEHFIGGYRTVAIPIRNLTAQHDKLVKTFVREARSLIEVEGVDVIIPQGISQCPTHIKPDWLSKELGIPVVEGIGAPIRMAAMLAGLGLSQSRIRWPKAKR